jgi:hypothetical protein
MGGLTTEQRKKLEAVVARRLGARSDGSALVVAYLDAMAQNGYARTVETSPVPTSLVAERSAILIEISRQLGRVVEDFEIQALFRVARPQARSMRTTLLATYSDDADALTLAWAKVGARQLKRVEIDGLAGAKCVFESEDRRDAYTDYLARSGIAFRLITDDEAHLWAIVVSDDLPTSDLPPKA